MGFSIQILRYVFLFSFLFNPFSFAESDGYKEALEYFKYREKHFKESSQDTVKVEENNKEYDFKDKKRVIALGYEFGANDQEFYAVEAGFTFLRLDFFHQDVSLEWKASNKNDDKKVTFLYGARLTSELFFLSPEISVGAGRNVSGVSNRSFMALKMGLNFSNRWKQKFLTSFHVYYRRDQVFKTSVYENFYGVTMKVGI